MKHMSRVTRLSFAATMILAAVLSSSGVAQATVSPTDEATDVIQVTQRDGAGGVHVERAGRGKLSKAALKSVDITRVDYEVDRVQQLLTVTYTVRHRPVPVKPFRLYYATVAMTDPRDYTAPTAVFLSRPGSTGVRVLSVLDETSRRCAGGTTTTAKGGRAVTQVVPFSCLGEDFEHGKLWSGVGIERRKGGDVAYDTAPRSRDLPLTEYVAPPAP